MLWLWLAPTFANPGVATIREAWKQTEARIAAKDAAVLSVNWNRDDQSWAAVGTYKRVLTAWYVNREEEPYPNQIARIKVERQTAARTETHTYLYGADGALRFAFAEGDGKMRAYWDGPKLIRVVDGDTTHDTISVELATQAKRLHEQGTSAFEMAKLLVDTPPPAAVLEKD